MAYKLIWSPAARDDLHDIIVFIARDNPVRAMSFGYELISETDRLQEFPESGRRSGIPKREYSRDYLPTVSHCVPGRSRSKAVRGCARLALSTRNIAAVVR